MSLYLLAKGVGVILGGLVGVVMMIAERYKEIQWQKR